MKKFINNILLSLNTEIPETLASRYRSSILLALVTIICGIFFSLVTHSFSAFWLPFIIGIILIIFAILYRHKIVNRGYIVVEGTCTDHINILPSLSGKHADGFVLSIDTGKQIRIATTKRKNPPPIGSIIRVYIGNIEDEADLPNQGYGQNVYGYEVISISAQ